ncbi:hypothetical protein B0T26DRAFT_46153 [Lasiosphaeria miniovina]|uniref:Uncharacterized protein n=1 Tax=Lasiosphaeria miniovina TaxID=1954250 RepID=A0AA40EA22_9PEZI|nr:uncharacterized protein B0T26DRAFT_46153 [Lasiosphaeria miniovina]KAK0733954.1 hypothetical protein B0T26DRAFT_46153 [Lasiosphaeria miniovina]
MSAEPQPNILLDFAENVALLSLLKQLRSPPKVNKPASAIARLDSRRTLSFARESSLAGVLALISGISNNPDHVVATCIEERPDGGGMRVLLAVNKRSPMSGDDVLARIKNGLETIFGLLSRVNSEDNATLEGEVLNAIFDMCHERILYRIGSRRGRNSFSGKSKAYLGDTLKTIRVAVQKRRADIPRDQFALFVCHTKDLENKLDKLEVCHEKDVISSLKGVAITAYRLSSAVNCSTITADITSMGINPNLKMSFLNRLERLANYRESSLYLLKTARKPGLFQHTEVIAVSLDAQYFGPDLVFPSERNLSSSISRCLTSTGAKFTAESVFERLQSNEATNDSSFVATLNKTIEKPKIHAEVQIAAYYELYPVANRPRVICSSKDACYLCNLFIKHQGVFHISKSHGKLYPMWCLPVISSTSSLYSQLNASMEILIMHAIRNVMNGVRPGPKFPTNESTAVLFSNSMSTLASFVQPEDNPSRRVITEMVEKIVVEPITVGDEQGQAGGNEKLEEKEQNAGEVEELPADVEPVPNGAGKAVSRPLSTENLRQGYNELAEGPRELRDSFDDSAAVPHEPGNRSTEPVTREPTLEPLTDIPVTPDSAETEDTPLDDISRSQTSFTGDSPVPTISQDEKIEPLPQPAATASPGLSLRPRRELSRDRLLDDIPEEPPASSSPTDSASEQEQQEPHLPKQEQEQEQEQRQEQRQEQPASNSRGARILAQGQPITLHLDSSSRHVPLPWFSTGTLDIYPDMEMRPAELRLHWLPDEQARSRDVESHPSFIRTQSLKTSTDTDSGSGSGRSGGLYYLSNDMDVVAIECIFSGAGTERD